MINIKYKRKILITHIPKPAKGFCKTIIEGRREGENVRPMKKVISYNIMDNQYNTVLKTAGPVSYTHLDVYKRQGLP